MSHRLRTAAALTTVAVLLALVTGGCGRRVPAASDSGGDHVIGLASPSAAPSSPDKPVATFPAATAGGPTAAPTSSPAPIAPAATPPPTAAPFEAPDLTAIERLLDELDAALGADATADTDEGSAP